MGWWVSDLAVVCLHGSALDDTALFTAVSVRIRLRDPIVSACGQLDHDQPSACGQLSAGSACADSAATESRAHPIIPQSRAVASASGQCVGPSIPVASQHAYMKPYARERVQKPASDQSYTTAVSVSAYCQGVRTRVKTEGSCQRAGTRQLSSVRTAPTESTPTRARSSHRAVGSALPAARRGVGAAAVLRTMGPRAVALSSLPRHVPRAPRRP